MDDVRSGDVAGALRIRRPNAGLTSLKALGGTRSTSRPLCSAGPDSPDNRGTIAAFSRTYALRSLIEKARFRP